MVTVKAPAKINWSLSVLRRREDGYHDILSLIQAVGLYDTLTFEDSQEIEIVSNQFIKKENNLVYKAIVALQNFTGINRGVKVTLKKEIPIGAGLGGGSSDGAATLKALNEFWQIGLSNEQLIEIGKTLGSDVPFFFSLPLCIVRGRGEILEPLKINKAYTLLLVKPSFGVSTRWAYEALNMRGQLTENYEKINNSIWLLYENLCKGRLNLDLWNDFEKVVEKRYPEVGKIKRKLIEAGAKQSLMSGSGSTVFGLFEGVAEAQSALNKFSGYWCKVVQTLID